MDEMPKKAQSLFDLKGRKVLVTGACGGIGRAISEMFAAQGAELALTDVSLDSCVQFADELSSKGMHALPFPADLSDKDAINLLAQQAVEQLGNIDTLVCCAGIEGHVGALTEVDDQAWDKLMNLNLQSILRLVQAFSPGMRERNFGRIILLSSIAGLRGNKAIGLYGIAKAGLSQMARNFAVELGPTGISTNCIAPGLIETPFSQGLMADSQFMERRLAMTPLRRVGQPDEVAGLALYLASDSGGFVCGQTLVVDGGTVVTDGN